MRGSMSTADASPPTVTRIEEGKAIIEFPGAASAFYNPVQEFNRDLTVLVLRRLSVEYAARRKLLIAKRERQQADANGDEPPAKRASPRPIRTGIHIVDALSASGLRAMRFALEVPDVERIVANDFSDKAVATIRRNIALNKVGHVVEASEADASALLFSHRQFGSRFDCVDLDPFGSPAVFIDSALQACEDEGILMITCTDVATLCGNAPEACHAKYGTMSMRAKACHEIALRIVINTVDQLANRYGRYVVPLLSVSVDFYVRIFLRVRSGPMKAKENSLLKAMIYKCVDCHSHVLQPMAARSTTEKGNTKYSLAHGVGHTHECEHCKGRMNMAGPLWAGRLHDQDFVDALLGDVDALTEETALGTQRRIKGMLTMIKEELPDVVLFVDFAELCSTLRVGDIKHVDMASALINAGYRCSISHCSARAVKTTAPPRVVWDVMRAWIAKMGDAGRAIVAKHASNSPAANILATAPTIDVDFTTAKEAQATSKKSGLLRFQLNKGNNWGPKQKNKGSVASHQAAMYDGRRGEEEGHEDGE